MKRAFFTVAVLLSLALFGAPAQAQRVASVGWVERIELGDDKLAIFYGAGHFKGMEKILSEEMGFKQVGEPQWITAWDLTQPTPTTGPSTVPAR